MTYSVAKKREEENSAWTDEEIAESKLREYVRQMLYDAAEQLEEDQDEDL